MVILKIDAPCSCHNAYLLRYDVGHWGVISEVAEVSMNRWEQIFNLMKTSDASSHACTSTF